MTRSSSLITRYLRYWLPVLLWMGVIFVASSQPELPFVLNKTVDFVTKKAAHVTEYGVLAFLLWRAISKERGWPYWPSFGGAFAVSLLYAISDEFHQTFVPGRSGRLTDVGFDALGALLALGLVWWFAKDDNLPKESLLLDFDALQFDELQDGQEGDDDLQA
jgi:VanZ family protein